MHLKTLRAWSSKMDLKLHIEKKTKSKSPYILHIHNLSKSNFSI